MERCLFACRRDDLTTLRLLYKERWGSRLLIEAIEAGAEGCVRWLLRHGADPNHQPTKIHLALATRVSSALWCLVDQGLTLDPEEAMHWACRLDNLELVQSLVEWGAPLEWEPDTALEVAAAHGSWSVLRWLVEEMRVDVQSRDSQAIRYAHGQWRHDVVEYLLHAGADPEAGGHAMWITACRAGRLEMAEVLVNGGTDMQVMEGIVFSEACLRDDLVVAKWLLRAGFEMDVLPAKFYPLVCRRANLSTVQWLYRKGWNPRIDEDRPLRWACKGSRLDTAEWLMSVGADPRSGDDRAFYCACRHGRLEVMQWLHQFGVDLRANDCLAWELVQESGSLLGIAWLNSLGAQPATAWDPRRWGTGSG